MKILSKEFILKDLWRKPIKAYSPRKMFLIRQLRIFALAFKGFSEDRVQLRASALTYYSLLSIVPIVALAFGIAKGFGVEIYLQEELLKSFSGQEEVLQWILKFVEKYLSRIRGGVIAGVGVVVLLYTVMKLLGNIENSFNDIWQIKKARVMSRKMSDYISLVVITPLLLIVSSGVTVFLSDQIKTSSDIFPLLAYIGTILNLLVSLIPFVLIWLVFTLLYLIMPNTKVNFKSALIGGVIAGTMFQLLQWGYIYFQSYLTSYGAIYGSFAALPLFLIWMQMSWLFVLFGAEVAFANQNVEHYEAESESFNISNHMKRTVTLMILREIVVNFRSGEASLTAEQLANKLDFPVRLIREIIYELMETGIVSETVTKNIKENAYQPGKDVQILTVGYVLEQLDKRGNDSLITDNTKDLSTMMKVVDGFMEEIQKSKHNKPLFEVGK
ncbi:MAG: YihY/virulence factor BrkB family protein [Bacteroidales bacterium]|nr:YihY/virulence factor BrkB family protein [Bacteroidales bacterium]